MGVFAILTNRANSSMPVKIPKDLFSRIFARCLTLTARVFDWNLTNSTTHMINELRNLARNTNRKTLLSIYYIALADLALTILVVGTLTYILT